MLQVKLRSDTSRGVRFMATICLYQDTRHAQPLSWMREVLGIGYLSHRNDGMTELRINGFVSVQKVLIKLRPFIKFKGVQADALLQACEILKAKKIGDLCEQDLRKLVAIVFLIRDNNYKSKATLSKETLLLRLGLTP